jgi:hypothetical protein
MSAPSREEMLALGRTAGQVSSREEAEQIIQGLLGTVRSIRETSGMENEIAWSLMAAIEGIRETMPRFDEQDS